MKMKRNEKLKEKKRLEYLTRKNARPMYTT